MINYFIAARKYSFLKNVMIRLVLALTFSSGAVAAMPMGADRMPHLSWEQVKMKQALRHDIISITADPGHGDIVAVTKGEKGNDIYLLDHDQLRTGWQKKGTLSHVSVSSVQYGLGRFFIFGIDRQTHQAIVVTSADQGQSWSQQKIVDSISHYDVAAFSATAGVVTGREGAVAVTTDGITWTEKVAPCGSLKKVAYLQRSRDEGMGFMVMDASLKKRDGFFLADDFSAQEALFSMDGITWEKTIAPVNNVAAGEGQLLIYGGKGFAYHYPGVNTGSDYAATDVNNVAPDFKAIPSNKVPLIKMTEEVISPIGSGMGLISVGKDLKTEKSVIIYSGNRIFFVADASPAENPIVALGAIVRPSEGTSMHTENGVIIVAKNGAAYVASTNF